MGFFSVWRGDYRAEPKTEKWLEMQRLGRPKQNAVFIGFSRDGFHWHRPRIAGFSGYCRPRHKKRDSAGS